ncbi:MAG: tRNA (adenosine(37)-N6)-threonylcarbamoyltransferase complex ATPase subunit type 1 TsaE, partial [Myxococcota bacterium]
RRTRHLGAALGARLVPGDVVWLEGELGAGKTFFARGLLRALGVSEAIPVTSPTFALVHEHEGRVPIRHLDLYRLGDVDERGWIDRDHLARLPLDRAAAVVVCNLFGVGEPIDDVAAVARKAGAVAVDDAAQTAGATTPSGAVGRRGHPAVLSFGRGKPMGAMGGGALVGLDVPAAEATRDPGTESVFGSWLRVLAWDAALRGFAFRLLAAIPRLGIGETPFDPAFERGALSPHRAALAVSALSRLEDATARRRSVALHLAGQVKVAPGWTPVVARDGERGVYPRLAVLAPRPAARDEALAALTRVGAGASGFYPSALDEVPGLLLHRAGDDPLPGARDLAARVMTLPTHGRLVGRRLDVAVGIMARISTTTA